MHIHIQISFIYGLYPVISMMKNYMVIPDTRFCQKLSTGLPAIRSWDRISNEYSQGLDHFGLDHHILSVASCRKLSFSFSLLLCYAVCKYLPLCWGIWQQRYGPMLVLLCIHLCVNKIQWYLRVHGFLSAYCNALLHMNAYPLILQVIWSRSSFRWLSRSAITNEKRPHVVVDGNRWIWKHKMLISPWPMSSKPKIQ